MVFELFTKEEVKYVNDDFKILDLDIIDTYDKKGIENKFQELLKCIKELECVYFDMQTPSITMNYEVRYEQKTCNKSDPTARVAIQRVETREELEMIYNYLYNIYNNRFCYSEKIFFVDYFFIRRTRFDIESKLHIGNEKFYKLKYSCLIKIALGLNWPDVKRTL